MENAGKLKIDDFLNHVGLRRDTKLTLKDVNVVKIYSSIQDEKDDIVFQFFTQLHAEDRQVIQKLHSSVTSQQTNEGRLFHISKRDVLFAVLNCFDPLLMQYVLHKLHLLGVAVPLLMPSVDNDDVYFLQWGLRPCFQHHALLDGQPTLPKYQFISVSAFRFGELDFSKSDLLNKLLTNLQNNDGWACFSSSSEDPEETVWSDGTLEVTWCTILEPTQTSLPPFLLLNLRGDGHQHLRQQNFCVNVSQILIVFFSQLYDDTLEQIYTMTETSHVIVVTNSTGQKEIKAFQNKKLTVIHCKGLSSQEISNILSESLVEKMKATNEDFKSSLNDLSDTSIKLNFIDDEQKFQRATRLAEEIVNDVPYNFQAYKEQMLHFTKSFIGFDNIRDIDEDSFCRKQDQCSREVEPKYLRNLLQCFKFDNNEQQIFFTSLYLCLEQKFGKRLQICTKMYMVYYEQLKLFLKFSAQKEDRPRRESDSKICKAEKPLLQELNENCLKVEHLLCLLWQYFRSSHSRADDHFNSTDYNECIKTWLMNGNSIDLVNFDSDQITVSWAVRLLNTIQTLREDRTCTRVVAAFGGSGAQSCRLLNQVFWTSFTQTDNLCSGGIRMQLIPIRNTSESSFAFDYLLLLDINTIGLAEIVLNSYSRKREYLLTLMSSITDVLIIYFNKDGAQVEESIMFDMIVHTALKFEQSVLSKCCVVYHEMDSGSPNVSDLRSYTKGILEKTCNKIHEREPNPSKQTYSENAALCKTVLSCFTNEGKINVKVLPKAQSNQDYVKSINDIKKFILLLLQQCQRGAFSLKEIIKTIFCQTCNMSREANYISDKTPFHKFVSPYLKIHQYYVSSIENITQKVSYAIALAFTTIKTADNKQEACCRLQTEVLELVNNDVEKVMEFLVFVGKNNCIFKDSCNNLITKLFKYKEIQLQNSSNKLQQVLENVRENDAIDHVIEIKTKEVLSTMKAVQEDDSERLFAEEHLEYCIKEYIHNMNKEYPQTPISEIKSLTKLRVTYELKKTKYGNHVNTLVETTNLADWSNPSESTNSIDGVRNLEKRFNVEDTRVAKVFAECQESLLALSTDYANFTINTEKVIRLLKRYLQSLQNLVDSLTMCIFMCIKFISGIHRHHARADMKSRNFSAIEIDFENYVVKHVEPLNFPSFKSKLSYIVPLFATMIPGDQFSDLEKTLGSTSVTNYDHIPFNLRTIQRLDRHFLWSLPVTSSQNVNNILHVVNDAKLYCLGRALGNSVCDFDDSFDYIFKLINHSLINGKDSEAIKAAAFVHVSAWLSPLISVKEYEKDSTTNVAYRAGKVVPILKFNILLDKQPLEKEFAKIFCDAMEDALLKRILQELQRKLREFLLQRSHVIFLKRSLIGRMLRSFCNQGDFEQFLSFVEDYDHCSRKYILLFLVTQINDGSEPLIWKLKGDVIEENITNAIQAVTQTTSHCVETGDCSLCAWMQTFTEHFEGLNDRRFEYLEKHVNFSDVEVFAEDCRTILRKLKHRLNDRIELPEKGNVDSTKTFLFSLSRNMHEEISTNIIGCIEQCPLCGNVCKFDLENHEYHSVLPHIPIGIKGGRDRESDELISLTCPSLVSNNNIFTSLDLEDEEISKLSTFMKNIHPTWHVQDAENDPHVFWKYIFNRFNRQFAEFYECREGKLPPEWKEYSMEDAIRSVERTYKLDRNEFLSH